MEAALLHLRLADPVLAAIIERVGPRPWPARDPTFETLARAITFQQLHGKAAATIFERLRRAARPRLTAASFLRLSPETLRACGLSRQKIASITDLAERVRTREISFRKLAAMSDEDVILLLSRVRGVGLWTAQMFLIFALNRLDVLPLNDAGILAAVHKLYGLSDRPTAAELTAIASCWQPYRSIACFWLWRSLDPRSETP